MMNFILAFAVMCYGLETSVNTVATEKTLIGKVDAFYKNNLLQGYSIKVPVNEGDFIEFTEAYTLVLPDEEVSKVEQILRHANTLRKKVKITGYLGRRENKKYLLITKIECEHVQ